MDPYCIEEHLNSIKVRDWFLFNKPQRFAYTPMPALQGAVQWLPLTRIVCVASFGEPSECSKSSTWRELAVIDFSLESFAPILEGSLVKWFTDSQTAARIIEVWSMKLDLHRLAIKIFQFCAEHSIRLEVSVDPTNWKWEGGLHQSPYRLWWLASHAWSLCKFGRVMGPAYSWLFCQLLYG